MRARRAGAVAVTADAGVVMRMKIMLAVAHRNLMVIYAAWSAGTATSAKRIWLSEKLKKLRDLSMQR